MALALLYVAQTKPDPIRALRQLLGETEFRVTKSTSAAQLAVRVVIGYGQTVTERRANRQYASWDAAALNYLADRGILPDKVIELGKVKGQGLEAWGRGKPRPSTENKHLGGRAPETSRNARKTENGAANASVLALAKDARKITIDLRQKDPLFLRKNDDGAIFALVPPIELERVDPVNKPKHARKLLAVALMIRGAKLWPRKKKPQTRANPGKRVLTIDEFDRRLFDRDLQSSSDVKPGGTSISDVKEPSDDTKS